MDSSSLAAPLQQSATDANPPELLSLADLRPGQSARVHQVRLPSDTMAHGHGQQLVLRLLEIGFVPGERVAVVALGPGGHEPLAVRVAGALFALRRHEAEHVQVSLC